MLKDVGMIPYYFNQISNLNSKILTYKINHYPFLEKYCKGLILDFIKRSKSIRSIRKYCEINVLKYLIKNAKSIHILNLYHLSIPSLIYALFYKWFNKNGFTYLKMDTDSSSFKKIDLSHYKLRNKNKMIKNQNLVYLTFKRKIINYFFKNLDLISFESRELCIFSKNLFPKLKSKFILVPNGIDDNFISESGIIRKPYNKKKNIILTVGRLGTYQKATEILLEAISKIKDLRGWNVYLIGSIESNFKNYLDKYFKINPHLRKNVFYKGEIMDRKKLYEFYQNSKIFCLTSRYEGFPIVLVEALYFGNYIISTNLHSSKDITLNGTLGKLFKIDNSDELAIILEDLINNDSVLKANYNKIIEVADKKFIWSNIIKNLFKEIIIRRTI